MNIRPSVRLTTLPPARAYADRFRLAAELGFEGVELESGSGDVAEMKAAAAQAGIEVHSLHTVANWTWPLSSGDPAVLAAGIRNTLAALEEAHALGADTLQLVPGRVDRETSYVDAYSRSQEVIRREILPAAEELGIVLGIENVWNGFLLSPLEYVRYIDEFDSLWVKAYIDVGNMIFGRPEDWIDIAGGRTVKLHLKDFRFSEARKRFAAMKIGDGDIDWRAVCAALERVGFNGWGTFAQAEHIQGRFAARIHRAADRAPRLLHGLPGGRQVAAAAQTFLARRLLTDVMARHRHYIAANAGQGD